MLRLRFLPGLLLGLVIGLPAGILITLLLTPPQSGGQPATVSSQIQDLTRKLELANEAKERADRQLEQFQKLAEQMTTSFNSLEQRFKLLEEEQRARDSQAAQALLQRSAAAPTSPSKPVQPPPESQPRPTEAGQAAPVGTAPDVPVNQP
jgi:TolA-binding protein